MTAPVPARQIESIMSEINSLLTNGAQVDPLKLRRLEVAFEKLWQAKGISPSEYYTTKAFFGIAKRQRKPAMEAAINALQLAPNDPIVQGNILTAFVGMADVSAAIPLMRKMAADHRNDKDFLRLIIVKAADLLQLSMVNELFEIFDNLCINDQHQKFTRRRNWELSLKTMTQCNLSDDALAERIKVAMDAIQAEQFDAFQSSRRHLPDGSIIYSMHVDATADVCAELNFSVADALVENFEDPGGDFIVFNCRPLTDLSLPAIVAGDLL